MIPFIIGTLTGLTAMVPLAWYLWNGWARTEDRRYIADFQLHFTRICRDEALRELAKLRPLAKSGRLTLARNARYRAKAKGK